MKYLFITFITIILASYCVRAQAPAEIVPEFNFYKSDKTAFKNKDLTTGKYLFEVPLLRARNSDLPPGLLSCFLCPGSNVRSIEILSSVEIGDLSLNFLKQWLKLI